jgi:hypothetical protein
VVADVRSHFGPLVHDTVIPRAVRLAEAPGFGLPITMYDPGSRASAAYRALASEFLARDPRPTPQITEPAASGVLADRQDAQGDTGQASAGEGGTVIDVRDDARRDADRDMRAGAGAAGGRS